MIVHYQRNSKSNLHYDCISHARKVQVSLQCNWIIAFQDHQTCVYGSPDPSDFFWRGRETMKRLAYSRIDLLGCSVSLHLKETWETHTRHFV